MNRSIHRLLILVVALSFAIAGCTDDDESDPRDPHSGGGGSGSTSGGNDDEPDIGVDVGDAANDQDVRDDDVDAICTLEPQVPQGDARFPCCFTTEDCRESSVPQADSMICYQASCTEGGEGTCRVPPQQELQCWDDYDCPAGYECPHDMTTIPYRCQDPTVQEVPPFCVEVDD